MHSEDKEHEPVRKSGNESTASPDKATKDVNPSIHLDDDDLKKISLTSEEVEEVVRPEAEEASPTGSSGPEEKDITG